MPFGGRACVDDTAQPQVNVWQITRPSTIRRIRRTWSCAFHVAVTADKYL